jgi:transposase-like protein
MEFTRRFPDDDACLAYLWRTRYSADGETALCPTCNEVRTFKHYEGKQQRQAWTCVACGQYLYPTAGTIFHKSSTSLHLWFYAMYIMASTRCGVSAKQLERELGVTYKTAWRMFTLIRNQLMTQDDDEIMSGEVEMDETFVGGRPRVKDRYAWKGMDEPARRAASQRWVNQKKTTVFGFVQRGGNVSAKVVPSTQIDTLLPHFETRVLDSTVIYTDEARQYDRLGAKGYQHRRIHHAANVYVQGDVHTNTIEGFWSLVKRGIGGSHHAVSAKYLQGYLNEYVWRYNRRNEPRSMFEEQLLRAATTPLR